MDFWLGEDGEGLSVVLDFLVLALRLPLALEVAPAPGSYLACSTSCENLSLFNALEILNSSEARRRHTALHHAAFF
eukprot:1367106-Amorphochlora_amoeboformis.AAC.1